MAVWHRHGSGSLRRTRSFTSTCPLPAHYWGVTKRFATGLFRNPKGWPENSPVWESTLDSYRVVGLCHRRLTPKYRQLVADKASSKRVYHLKSRMEMKAFIQAVEQQRG